MGGGEQGAVEGLEDKVAEISQKVEQKERWKMVGKNEENWRTSSGGLMSKKDLRTGIRDDNGGRAGGR